jgi:hypothetical protein
MAGTTGPFTAKTKKSSLQLSSSGGGLFDERPKDSNLGLGRFRFCRPQTETYVVDRATCVRNVTANARARYFQMCKSQSLYNLADS